MFAVSQELKNSGEHETRSYENKHQMSGVDRRPAGITSALLLAVRMQTGKTKTFIVCSSQKSSRGGKVPFSGVGPLLVPDLGCFWTGGTFSSFLELLVKEASFCVFSL